jgi:glutamyl-tRNA synthetase
MSTEKIKEISLKYTLQNAIKFNGKANPKAVIGKVIADLKKEGFSPKEIIPVVNSVIKDVNKIPLKKQIEQLEKIDPDLLKKEKKVRDFSLPDLPNAENGKVVTRFPPEPNGYLHIGHAKAVIVDYEYAKMYDGKFILRFDDTNPENAHPEFYEAQKEDLKWLGIEWDEVYNTSDNLEKHYKFAEQLIKQDNAYVCQCSPEEIKHGRFHGHSCNCCGNTCGNNIDLWKEMLTSSHDGAILRLRGDMTCDNTTMRDPTIFRIIEKPHPLHGEKYIVWPTYDFAGPIEDSISGVTHPFRTKEYELRDEGYFKILDYLNLRKPKLMEFARLSIEGMPVSKRKIRPLIERGMVSGFDDTRLPTLRGLKKRGILPKAIKQFVLEQGISKVESSVTFGVLEAINRKIIDPNAKRYFFVRDPVKLTVKNASVITKKINLHPKNKELGSRTVTTSDTFFIQNSDVELLTVGDILRLKDLYNVKILKKNRDIIAEYAGEELIPESLKIQWTTEDYIKMKILIPHLLFVDNKFNDKSLEMIDGFAEKEVSKIKTGEIVQFERFGFVRIENIKNKITGFFSHK